MPITFDATSFAVFLGFFGPLVVAAITGLKTSAKVKGWLSVGIITILAAAQAWYQGGISADIFKSILGIAVIWQTSYGLLWKSSGLTKVLQDNIPIKIGVDEDSITITDTSDMVDEGAPAQTDNGTKPEDPDQSEVSQDPTVVLDDGEEIPEDMPEAI